MKVLVATVCLLSLAYMCEGQATCYQCEYNKDAGMDEECMDPFMLRTPMVQQVACQHGCSKTVTTMDGDVTEVSRGCADENCKSKDCMEMGDEYKCTYCCDDNDCNIAVPLVVNIGLLIWALFISILMNIAY